jgi:hypothetical protein
MILVKKGADYFAPFFRIRFLFPDNPINLVNLSSKALIHGQ